MGNHQHLTLIDNIDNDIDSETTMDDVAIFHSHNDNTLQVRNTSAIDSNEDAKNDDDCTSTSSGDKSLLSQLCVPVNEPTNDIESTNNIDKMRHYLQTQCFEGSKWYHSLTFEGTIDKKFFSNIDIIQYVGNSSYKDKKGSDIL